MKINEATMDSNPLLFVDKQFFGFLFREADFGLQKGSKLDFARKDLSLEIQRKPNLSTYLEPLQNSNTFWPTVKGGV